MKNLLYILVLSTVALASCDLETSDNGDLDGYWLLERVDTLATGGTLQCRGDQRFWSFQSHLMQLTQGGTGADAMSFRFQRQGDELTLDNPCVFNRQKGDTPITDVEVLQPYGVNAMTEKFAVSRLTADCMELESGMLHLYFRKY